MNIDAILNLEQHKDYLGFGYLGHESRTLNSDRMLASAATELKLSIDEIFLWANSRPARHFMDSTEKPDSTDFIEELGLSLPELKGE